MASIVMACIVRRTLRPERRNPSCTRVRTYIVMAYIVMAYIVMAYIVMAHIVMAYIVMAHIVIAYIVVAYIVMAARRLRARTTRRTLRSERRNPSCTRGRTPCNKKKQKNFVSRRGSSLPQRSSMRIDMDSQRDLVGRHRPT